jgi:hypothetical protein
MNRKILIILLLLILPKIVSAAPARVQVLNLEYEKDKLSVIDQVVKLGYYPDRKVQPDNGFRATIFSEDEAILYDFKFKIPNKIFVDVTDSVKDELSGGIIELNKTQFALIVPYFSNAKEIRFYNEKNNQILSIDLSEEKLASKKRVKWLIAGGLFVFIAAIFLYLTRKK